MTMAKKKDKETKPAKAAKPKADKPAKASKGKGKGGGFDTAKIKEFAINYGERIGLGVAGFLMFIFLLYGLILAFSARSPHAQIQQSAAAIGSRVQSSTPPEGLKDDTIDAVAWELVADMSLETPAMFFDPGAVGDNKVTNPTILPPGSPKLQTIVYRDPINPAITSKVKFKFDVPRGSETKTIETDQIAVMQECQIDVIRGPIVQYYLDSVNKTVEFLEENAKKTGAAPTQPTETAGSAAGYLLTQHLEPLRMVVVQTTFPYHTKSDDDTQPVVNSQLENFRKALRKDHVSELFSAEDTIPWFNGLIVKRGELTGDNKPIDWKEWKVIIGQDRAGNVVLSPKLKTIMQTAVLVDEPPPTQPPKAAGNKVDMLQNPAATTFPKEIQPGLVMPLPMLAFGEYPKVNLPDIKLAPTTTVGGGMFDQTDPTTAKTSGVGKLMSEMLNKGDKGGPGYKLDYLAYKELAKKEYGKAIRFLGKVHPYPYGFYPFYPTGEFVSAKKFYGVADAKGMAAVIPTKQTDGDFSVFDDPMADPMNNAATNQPEDIPQDLDPFKLNQTQVIKEKDRKLIRFIDVDVEPGKTYIYSLQVRMANPNYKHPERVAFKALSDEKELLSPVVWTRPVVISPELEYYVVDQDLLDPKYLTREKASGFETADKGVSLQIHRWVKDFELEGSPELFGKLGAWIIADQMKAHRGEFLGKNDVVVQLPVWDVTKMSFSLTAEPGMVKGKTSRDNKPVAFVDLQPHDPPPLVVDYKGGRKAYPDKPGKYAIKDEGAIQMLVLSPSGKLELLNSGRDSDPRTPYGIERVERYAAWQEMLEKMKKLTQPPPITTGTESP
jgi:hypothetical protein